MDPPINSSNEENIPRGCLKLNNKIYPVYEGLNTVGRNPEAVINIKNLNISQQHAVITVVDGNSHYISDFKSSNGTVLDNKKLKPLKLYKLLNGASIKFADIFCTYKKLDNNEFVLDNPEETQNFGETFYEANTQAIHLPNSDELIINEMPTQVMEPAMLGISEMATQATPPQTISFNKIPIQAISPKTISFNELPTQVFNYNDSKISNVVDDTDDNSSSDSVDFITMQKATQSQGFALNHSDSDTEEQSSIVPIKLNSNKKVLTSDSAQSTPEILPVKLNSTKIISSDSEDSKKCLTHLEQEEPLSQICPVRTSIKKQIESDSDTDTEEYNIPRAERRKSRYVISDDDETDIEDADKAETTMNTTDIIPNTQEVPQKSETSKCSRNLEQSSMDSFRLELSERIDENEENKENNLSSVAQDHVYCQDPQTSSSKDNEGVQKQNFGSEDHIYCRSLEASQEKLDLSSKDHEEEAGRQPTKAVESSAEKSEEMERSSVEERAARGDELAELASDNHKSDQLVEDIEKGSGEGPNLQNIKQSLAENLKEGENVVDIVDQSTKLGLGFVDDETQSIVGDNEDHDSELTEELINEQEKLESTSDHRNLDQNDENLEVKKSDETVENDEKVTEEVAVEDSKEEEKIVENIFDQPTQQLPLDFIDDDTLSIVGDHDSKLTEELTLPADQTSEQQKDEEKKKEPALDMVGQGTLNQSNDDIFDQPTQQIDVDFVGDKVKDDDIYFQPTQKLSTFEDNPNKCKIEEDEIYIQPTQQINQDVGHTSKSAEPGKLDGEDKNSEEKNLSSVKDHDFARPFELFSPGKKAMHKNDEDDDDSLLLPPTQALEYLHKEDEASTSKQPDVSDHNSNSNEVEDQLEMLFYSQSDHKFVATQQLVDVLEDKNDNEDIIDDSMIEDIGLSSKSKVGRFNTVDSIRMILDDDLEEATDKKKEDNVAQTEAKANDLQSGDNQDKRTRKRKELLKENSTDQEEKKEKRIRKEKIVELKEDIVDQDRAARSKTRSRKNDDKESEIAGDASNDKVEKKNIHHDIKKDKLTGSGKTEENNADQRSEKESETGGKGRPTRKGRGEKDDHKEIEVFEDKSNEKIENPVNVVDVKKSGRIGKEKAKGLKDKNIEQSNDGKGRLTRKTRGRKDDDTGSEISEDGSTRANTPVNIEEGNINQTKKTEDVKQNKRQTKATTLGVKKDNNKEIEISEDKSNDKVENPVNVIDEMIEDVKKSQRIGKEKPNELTEQSVEQSKVGKGRPTRKTRGRKDDDTGSEISEDGSNRADTPVITEEKNVNQTKKVEDVKQNKRQTKAKKDETVETIEAKDNAKIRPVRSSKRVKKDDDNGSESSETKSNDGTANALEEKESYKRNRGKRKNVEESSEESNQTIQNPPETEIQQASSVTRKRNLKTTTVDSGDEFEPKIQKVETPKSSPTKQKNKVVETMVRPETPTTRKSGRTRKLKLDEDEVISVPSSSSATTEVISISTSSSVSEEPPKKSRRLSANSRAQKNEEEKTKQKEVKGRGRKASIQQSPPVVPSTPERSKRQLKPKVVFTMMDNPELESLIRQLGGSVVDTVDACTVLVTVSVKRSQKLLCAVGQAKPICSPQWLHACKKAFSFLDPWDYILVDKEAEKKWDFSLRESLNRSRKGKLLENYTFQLIVNTAADVLKGAIEACGGKCVTRNLPKAETDNKIIVSSSDNKNKYSKIVKQDPSIKVVEAEAIFDGTLRQEFRFDEYLLT